MAARNAIRDRIVGSPMINGGIPTVVASFGRSGSSLLTASCVQSLPKSPWLTVLEWFMRSDHLGAWDLNDVRPVHWVYKTHAVYRPCLPSTTRAVYVFANLDDVLGSHEAALLAGTTEWRTNHLRHFCAEGLEDFSPASLYKAFKIRENFLSWYEQTTTPVAFVHIDALWAAEDRLSDFLGYRLKISEPHHPRGSRPAKRLAVDDYDDFACMLNDLPPFFVRNA